MKFIDKINILTKNLEKCERVKRHSTETENHAGTFANALIDIEESVMKISKDFLSKLYLTDLRDEEVDDIVLEIGEELRHILYHINDIKVFSYLNNDKIDNNE